MKYYRPMSLALAIIFAAVGILFVVAPDGVLRFFDSLSPALSLPQMPLMGYGFYLILAGAYMYVVTVLAFMMYRLPRNGYFPLLLVHAKLASSVLSIVLFLFQSRYLIYAANFLVDGTIGVVILAVYLKLKRKGEWASS